MIKWRGYGFVAHISEDKFSELWERFKRCESQKAFYMKFVNQGLIDFGH